MRPGDIEQAEELDAKLIEFHNLGRPLPGIAAQQARQTYVEQLIESIRRVKFVAVIQNRPIDPQRRDPSHALFDPLRAAILHHREGNVDEAFWLVFLFVHFSKHHIDGYRLVRDIYGALGGPRVWTWAEISPDPDAFRQWLVQNQGTLIADGVTRRFGGHRSYESIRVDANRNLADVFESYVRWVGPNRGHALLFQNAHEHVQGIPTEVFDNLFTSMSVLSFGRLAKFDYLTMLSKLGFVDLVPGSPYLKGSTGPLQGAKLLFTGDTNSEINYSQFDRWVKELGDHLGTGMQEMEDSICNWQKSPNNFVPFRG